MEIKGTYQELHTLTNIQFTVMFSSKCKNFSLEINVMGHALVDKLFAYLKPKKDVHN